MIAQGVIRILCLLNSAVAVILFRCQLEVIRHTPQRPQIQDGVVLAHVDLRTGQPVGGDSTVVFIYLADDGVFLVCFGESVDLAVGFDQTARQQLVIRTAAVDRCADHNIRRAARQIGIVGTGHILAVGAIGLCEIAHNHHQLAFGDFFATHRGVNGDYRVGHFGSRQQIARVEGTVGRGTVIGRRLRLGFRQRCHRDSAALHLFFENVKRSIYLHLAKRLLLIDDALG